MNHDARATRRDKETLLWYWRTLDHIKEICTSVTLIGIGRRFARSRSEVSLSRIPPKGLSALKKSLSLGAINVDRAILTICTERECVDIEVAIALRNLWVS